MSYQDPLRPGSGDAEVHALPSAYLTLDDDGLFQLLEVLPAVVRERIERLGELEKLMEIVLDYGRPAEVRYRDRTERFEDVIVSEHDIDVVAKQIGEFGFDNRAGIERTLHRISCIRNRHGKIVGLTCRVGRALEGTIDIIDDIVRSGKSILILGRPGVGKTTKLREVARVLADEVGKRVIIVDTSNEIAGDGDVPHPGIGSARRMQVRVPAEQHQVMIEAVENHMPEVIVIDEIGNEAEAQAARTIAERGVQLIGTAHGQTLENLMLNPSLADLIGGIQAVTLSDDEARRRGTQKTVLERKSPPTFDVVIELMDFDRLAVHSDVQRTVDVVLRGIQARPEIRTRNEGRVEVLQAEDTAEVDEPGFNKKYPALARNPNAERDVADDRESAPRQPRQAAPQAATGLIKLYPYGIARTRLERAVREKRAPIYIVNDIVQADVVMAIRSTHQAKPRKLRDLAGRPIPTVVIKTNTYSQIAQAIEDILRSQGNGSASMETDGAAMEEALRAIDIVLQNGKPVELAPQPAPVRKQQHQLAEARRLASEAVGEEPHRRLRILPTRLT
jgi:stage III sporulation protein SpoIIIAA